MPRAPLYKMQRICGSQQCYIDCGVSDGLLAKKKKKALYTEKKKLTLHVYCLCVHNVQWVTSNIYIFLQ